MTPQNNRTLVPSTLFLSLRPYLWIVGALAASLLHAQVTINNAVPATTIDPVVALRFLEVMHLQRSPLSLMTPGVCARVLAPKSQSDERGGAHVAHEETA